MNRYYIQRNFVMARKKNPDDYEVQYLEAKTFVNEVSQTLPNGELRTAIIQAMGIFNDLEAIEYIFDLGNGGLNTLSTMVDVTEIYPYLKKYDVPYRSGRNGERLAHRLHKDYVMSYILPIRYTRVNRIEVLLGGKAEPVPPPPSYNQMMRISTPPEIVRPNVNVEELKNIVGQAIKARVFNERERMRDLLADDFVYGFYQGRKSKTFFLNGMTGDQSVRGFEITYAELSFKGAVPALATKVRYQSLVGEKFKSYNYVFTFVKQRDKWLIQTWKPA